MHRAMTGFHTDDQGDWVAELSCLHRQHVRHHPPFWEAAWIDNEAERNARIGEPLDCSPCDRAELPTGLHVARTTSTWDAATMPPGIRRAHRIAAGTWGLLEVEVGEVRFQADTGPALDIQVTSARPQPIPPEVDHHVELTGRSRFHITFLTR